MPIQIKYLDNGIGVMLIGKGMVTGADIISANKQVFSSEESMRNYKYGFVDYSFVSDLNATTSEIESMAYQQKKASEFIPDGVLAFVAKSDLEYGLNRMWQSIAENAGLKWETMVFRSREKAEIWIKNRIKEKFNIDITMA